ncbi:WD40 repeat domain-containing protein [Pokkaliibacter plantistimulans]|nr:PQQ-binding-like beta-propeller repeat protein [Pokkaliibacter plantistimulans]
MDSMVVKVRQRRCRWQVLLLSVMLVLSGCSDREPQQANELALRGLYSGVVSADARFSLIGSVTHGGSLWQVDDNKRLYDWNHRQGEFSNLVAMDIDDNDKYAVTAASFDFVLWDMATGKALDFRRAPSEIMDLSLSANGQLLALGLTDQTAVLFDLKAGKIIQTLLHDSRVRKVDLNAQKGFLLTGDDSFVTTLWDINSGKMLHQLNLGNQPSVVTLSDDGKLAFSAAQLSKAIVWDTLTGQVKYTLASMDSILDRKATFTAARFIDKGQRLLTGTSSGKVMLWDMRTGSLDATWQLHRRNELKPVSVSVVSVASKGGVHHYALGSNGFLNILQGP